jgi:hypothetical protein
VDSQVVSYLADADVLVSADKGLVAVCERLHAEAPFPVARPVRVRSPQDAGPTLVGLLTRPPPATT